MVEAHRETCEKVGYFLLIMQGAETWVGGDWEGKGGGVACEGSSRQGWREMSRC